MGPEGLGKFDSGARRGQCGVAAWCVYVISSGNGPSQPYPSEDFRSDNFLGVFLSLDSSES
jgi:hypothetical protein